VPRQADRVLGARRCRATTLSIALSANCSKKAVAANRPIEAEKTSSSCDSRTKRPADALTARILEGADGVAILKTALESLHEYQGQIARVKSVVKANALLRRLAAPVSAQLTASAQKQCVPSLEHGALLARWLIQLTVRSRGPGADRFKTWKRASDGKAMATGWASESICYRAQGQSGLVEFRPSPSACTIVHGRVPVPLRNLPFFNLMNTSVQTEKSHVVVVGISLGDSASA